MAVAHVNSASDNFNGSDTAQAVFTGTVGTGNTIIVAVFNSNKTLTVGVTDSQGNEYSQCGSYLDGYYQRLSLWRATNITGGASFTVTATLSASGQYGGVIAHEVSGIATSSELDQTTGDAQDGTASGTAVGTGTDAITSGAVSTTTDGQYVFAATLNDTYSGIASTQGTGYTDGLDVNDSGVRGHSEYLIQASAGSVAGTFTGASTADWLTGVATFKAAEVATGQFARSIAVYYQRLRG